MQHQRPVSSPVRSLSQAGRTHPANVSAHPAPLTSDSRGLLRSQGAFHDCCCCYTVPGARSRSPLTSPLGPLDRLTSALAEHARTHARTLSYSLLPLILALERKKKKKDLTNLSKVFLHSTEAVFSPNHHPHLDHRQRPCLHRNIHLDHAFILVRHHDCANEIITTTLTPLLWTPVDHYTSAATC